MTPLEPVVSEAELTLLLLVFIAVMQLVCVVVTIRAGVQRLRDRRAVRPALTGRVGLGDEPPPGYRAPVVTAVTRGQQAARDLEAYQRAGGRR